MERTDSGRIKAYQPKVALYFESGSPQTHKSKNIALDYETAVDRARMVGEKRLSWDGVLDYEHSAVKVYIG